MVHQTTKNQHYVPQFLLGGFDAVGAEKPKVHIYDLEKGVVRKNQAVKEVFSQNYFYDINNEVENFLSSNIEGPASEIINRIRNNDFSMLGNGSVELIKFMCCQNARTVEARENVLYYINSHFYQIVLDLNRLNDLGIDDPESYKLSPSDKDSMRDFNAELALNGFGDAKHMEDLEFHILINKTKEEFILSDHAISRYNWFYRSLNDPRIGSMLAKGVQLFLPLSEKVCLCAYDAKVYKYGNKSSSVSELWSESDVYWLNQLQMRNARSFIAFKSMFMVGSLEKLHALFYGRKIYSIKSSSLEKKDIGEVQLYPEQVKFINKPTFFKVLKKAKKMESNFEWRNPDIWIE